MLPPSGIYVRMVEQLSVKTMMTHIRDDGPAVLP